MPESFFEVLRGHADHRLVRTASALAALVCQGVPGVFNSPTEAALTKFLELGDGARS